MPHHYRCDSPMDNGLPARRLHSIDDTSELRPPSREDVMDDTEDVVSDQETLDDAGNARAERETLVDDVEDTEDDQSTLDDDNDSDDDIQIPTFSSPNPVYIAGSIATNSPVVLQASPSHTHGNGSRSTDTDDEDDDTEILQPVQIPRNIHHAAHHRTLSPATDSTIIPSPSSSDFDDLGQHREQEETFNGLSKEMARSGSRSRIRSRIRSRRFKPHKQQLPSPLNTAQIQWAQKVRAKFARSHFTWRWQEGESPTEIMLQQRLERKKHESLSRLVQEKKQKKQIKQKMRKRSGMSSSLPPPSLKTAMGRRIAQPPPVPPSRQSFCSPGPRHDWRVWTAREAEVEDLRVAAVSREAGRVIEEAERFLAEGGVVVGAGW